MKKSLFAAVLSIGICISLCGCGGNNTKVITGDVNTTTVNNNQVAESTDVVAAFDDIEGSGYVFSQGDVNVIVDADASPMIEALGTDYTYYEAASCAFEGKDKMYTYLSFEIDTYPNGEIDRVSTVILKDDSVSTKEGVSIGDPVSKMTEVYGTEYADEDGMCVYYKDKMKLCFIVNNDSIASIRYSTTVLDEK